ncbi:hypothetical protein BpHYR1_015098 [Brachionus plicatilis]|uniref:Uncharacterized protein n=1 Tax=Brachionus plicatilis TaxID=10195 RepID=A0A3M7RNH4_BRAPC|nr:hypothetical protein BpHYR1_015098 [Brachionus plicatilis]
MRLNYSKVVLKSKKFEKVSNTNGLAVFKHRHKNNNIDYIEISDPECNCLECNTCKCVKNFRPQDFKLLNFKLDNFKLETFDSMLKNKLEDRRCQFDTFKALKALRNTDDIIINL